ncbi:MAG: class I mannose-6-phosphate isomerase [Candidatus Riflebacteria bacterium]|nr:class I mannose-6-phosphate isomerase [Candidatus Riflebacteria bacterium]
MRHSPFLLEPAFKDYLWGGNRLNDDFAKNINAAPLAETWECSTHPDGASIIASGSDKGRSLPDVLQENPEFLGSHALELTGGKPELPILIKLIDAKQDLSVQVHPDDEYAKQYEGEPGKTEMWYVLHARKGARLVYGFNQQMDRERVRKALSSGRIENFLNYAPVNTDDLFFVEPGTVHAIGEGTVLAEIQTNSNITYRLYDYGRADKHGNKRPLHIDKALDVLNFSSSAIPKQPMRLLRYKRGGASELLARCKTFQTERLLINTETCRGLCDFQTGGNSFHALLCIKGCGVLFGENFMLNFFKGDCIFAPANSIPLKLHGKAELLDVSC